MAAATLTDKVLINKVEPVKERLSIVWKFFCTKIKYLN